MRIAENFADERLASVRMVNLDTLATEYPQHPVTRSVLAAALDDPSPEVQLRAAIVLGADGHDALLRLARRDDVDETVVIRAIATLDAHYPEHLAIETLHRTCESGRLQVARACIDRLALSGAARCVQDLATLLSSTSLDLAAAAAHALGSVANQTAEDALVGALGSPAGEVRLAAVVSLGRIGSALAVAPLQACGADHRFDASLRSAIRQSVATIQSRIAGASPGQLTLAAEEVGQVSLADTDARGQVSLVARPETLTTVETVQDVKRRPTNLTGFCPDRDVLNGRSRRE